MELDLQVMKEAYQTLRDRHFPTVGQELNRCNAIRALREVIAGWYDKPNDEHSCKFCKGG